MRLARQYTHAYTVRRRRILSTQNSSFAVHRCAGFFAVHRKKKKKPKMLSRQNTPPSNSKHSITASNLLRNTDSSMPIAFKTIGFLKWLSKTKRENHEWFDRITNGFSFPTTMHQLVSCFREGKLLVIRELKPKSIIATGRYYLERNRIHLFLLSLWKYIFHSSAKPRSEK